MRCALLAGAILLSSIGTPAVAGVRMPAPSGCFPNEVPCPSRCSFGVSGQGVACQFRFRPDGGLDALTVSVTLRDAFDFPVADCSTSVTIHDGAGTLALCGCGPMRQGEPSGADGTMQAVFARLGGRGDLSVSVSAHCHGNVGLFQDEIPFTSPDLDGSCDTGASAVTVIDLGIWAACLPPGPYCRPSDFNCDGSVSVIDLGMWAGALGSGCGGAPLE